MTGMTFKAAQCRAFTMQQYKSLVPSIWLTSLQEVLEQHTEFCGRSIVPSSSAHLSLYIDLSSAEALLQFSFFFRVLHTMFSHLRAHAFALSVTVARSSAVQASSSRRQERRWAIVCGSPQSQSTDWASSR